MGRIIRAESISNKRKRLIKSIRNALFEMEKQKEMNVTMKDLASFIVLNLWEIEKTVEATVQAWEKRGYWLKADRFRFQWKWVEQMGDKMYAAIMDDSYLAIIEMAKLIANHINDKSNAAIYSYRHSYSEDWIGAWDKLINSSNFN